MKDWSSNQKRSVFYGLAGIYLLYLAYELYGNLPEISGKEHMFCMIFMVLFVVGGVGILFFAFRLFRKKEQPNAEESEKEIKE